MYSFHELADIVQNEIKDLKYPQQPELLYAPIVYSLEEGGKRIRPVALLMACNLFRDEIDCAKPAALAVEVFHNFTLLTSWTVPTPVAANLPCIRAGTTTWRSCPATQ